MSRGSLINITARPALGAAAALLLLAAGCAREQIVSLKDTVSAPTTKPPSAVQKPATAPQRPVSAPQEKSASPPPKPATAPSATQKPASAPGAAPEPASAPPTPASAPPPAPAAAPSEPAPAPTPAPGKSGQAPAGPANEAAAERSVDAQVREWCARRHLDSQQKRPPGGATTVEEMEAGNRVCGQLYRYPGFKVEPEN